MASKVNVAIIQDSPVFMDLKASTDKALSLITKACSDGAQIIALPETWFPGYPVWLDEAPAMGMWDHPGAKALYRLLYENSVEMMDETLARFQDAADKNNCYLVIGANEREGKTLYNTIFTFAPKAGQPMRHRKLTPTYTEKLLWGVGDGSMLDVQQTPWGPLGALICWEHWLPLLRAAMHDQSEVVHVAQWPAVSEPHMIASRQYAFEGRTFVLASGMILQKGQAIADVKRRYPEEKDAIALLETMAGDDDTWLKNGGSAIIAPDTSFVVEPVFEKAAILMADLDIDQVREGQMALDVNGHYSRPDIFELTIDRRPKKNVKTR